MLLRYAAHFSRSLDIIVDRFGEGGAQIGHWFAIESNHFAGAGNVANKTIVHFAVLDKRGIAIVCHHVHGLIPAGYKNSEASRPWWVKIIHHS